MLLQTSVNTQQLLSSHGKVDIVGVGIPFNEQIASFPKTLAI